MGINILSSPAYVGVTVVASLLPDIDHTKSPIGKVFYPIAKYLNRNFGHRTITHTIIILLLGSILAGAAGYSVNGTRDIGLIFFLAYLSHLILDMVTMQGVPLFYPFFKNPCVIPGDPSYRMRSGHLRSELIAFFFFLSMFVFFRPLMENGWWTSYNSLWGTTKALASEFKKSEDLLIAHYEGHKGSEQLKGSGYVLDAQEGRVVLLGDDDQFKILDKQEMVITNIIPEHTQKQFFFDTKHFVGITEDSLNLLLLDQQIWELEIHSNNQFEVWHNNRTHAPTKQFKGELATNLFIHEAIGETPTLATHTPVTNPRIKLLQEKQQRIQQRQSQNQTEYQATQNQVSELETNIAEAENLVQRELWYEELKELQKIKPPTDYSPQLAEVQSQIRELKKLDQLKNEAGRREARVQNEKARKEPSRFTGYLTIIRIEEVIHNK